MNPRERLLCALALEEPDRVPYWEYSIDDGIVEALVGRRLTPKEVCRQFDRVDLEFWRKPPIFSRRDAADARREFVGAGLIRTRADLDLMVMPDPAPAEQIEKARAMVADKQEYALGLIIDTGPNPTMLSMGYDGFSYALADDPGLVHEVMNRYVEWILTVLGEFQGLGFDWIGSGDDLAFKTGPFFSPAIFREFFMPGMRRVADAIELPWIFHSDGNLMPILDDLLALGIDALNPIEPMAMDIFELKREYGDRLCLVGNIDVDNLSRGTPESVREEVRRKIHALAPGGGYVASSSNTIPEYVKPENFAAMIQAIRDFGAYPIAENLP